MSLIGNVDTPASYVADYMQACVGMLGIPAGGFTADIEAFGATNEFDVEALYSAMLNSSIGRSIYAPGSSNATFAAKLVEKLGGSLLSDDAEAWAIDYAEAQLDAGISRAALAMELVEAVSAVDTTDENFGAVAQQFANRIEIANYYTFTSTSPSSSATTLTAVLSSVTNATDVSDPAAVLTANTSGGVSTGTTSVLTTAIDSIPGTTGNDTIIGDAATTSAADQIVGGAGTDTLKLYGNAAKPVFSGVETVYLNGNTSGMDISANADVTTLQLDDATTAQTYTIASTVANASVANMAGNEVIDFAGNTVTALTVAVDGLGTATGVAAATTDVQIDFNSTAQTAVTLNATTTAAYVQLLNTGAGLVTVNATGSKALGISSLLTTVKTIDASTSTGGVNVGEVGASALTFTGGSGDDRINMVATLTTTDTLVGGTGTDTIALSGAADATFTSATGARISGFEVLEIGETADSKTYNVDNIIANNALTGVTLTVTGAGATTTVSNINTGALGNITFTGDAPEATLVAKDLVAGGTSDTATINFNNDTSDNADGVDATLTFTNVDVLNLVTTKSNTQGLQQNSAILTTTDVEKIVVTGNDSMLVQTAAGTVPTEIDGSGMTSTAVLSVDTDASAIASILVKGTANADSIDIDNAATISSTIYTGGGSDALLLDGAATTVNTLVFTSTALNAGDIKAGNALTIALAAATDGSQLIFNTSSTLEALLKSGGTVLGTSSSNVTITGTSLGATTNVAATNTNGAPDTVVFQIDLDGDGAYVAASDWQVTVTLTGNGNTGASTLVYNAANDYFLLTVA